MKTANPFIPTVSLITVPSRSRRERFKIAVFSVLAAHLVFLLVLLVQGMRTDYAAVSIPPDAPATVPAATPNSPPSMAEQKVLSHPANPAVLPAKATLPGAAQTAVPSPSAGESLHVVKNGETLSSIARSYGTSIKAIKMANALNTERLAVGTRLKIPLPHILTASVVSLSNP